MTADKRCRCGKPLQTYAAHCSWECNVDEARASGLKEVLPNGLPVAAISASGLLLECDGGDHPDYKFPVAVEFCGDITNAMWVDFLNMTGRHPVDDDEVRMIHGETHALIYSDEAVALTTHENCYAMWYLSDGSLGGGSLWGPVNRYSPQYRLTAGSIAKIKERFR